MAPIAEYWNHNVHYQRVILNAVPPGCRAAIDVGCGDGVLARELAGLARNGSPADWMVEAAGMPVNWYYKITRREGSSGAPVKDPAMTWAEVRVAAAGELPGARYRRHLLWRYSLIWDKPA